MIHAELLDSLAYASYRAQRELYGMSAERAIRFYTDHGGYPGAAFEARYQAEKRHDYHEGHTA